MHYFLCSLLLRRECCTFSNGEYVKSGLAELEKWIVSAKEEVNAVFSSSNCYSDWSKQDLGLNYYVMQFAGTSWHELNYIRQAVGFLVWVILLWFALCRCWLIYTFYIVYYAISIGNTSEEKKVFGWDSTGFMSGRWSVLFHCIHCLKKPFERMVSKFLFLFYFDRHWRLGKYIEYVLCTGMTNMAHRVYQMRQVEIIVPSMFVYLWVNYCPLGLWSLVGWQVVAQMREILNKDNHNLSSNSFLLDDDLR